ncbi:MAG: AAA family ATPase [Microbacteriaceae bacterium]|nr:AAA family ATPase [Microbacteriaceae bacterium]
MKLTSFRVKVFRNIIDSGEIPAESVTCLVGKNESGKSALLQALHHLNPAKPAVTLDLLDEYPRWLKKEHEITGEIANAVPISATFELDPSEVQELEDKLGKGILKSKSVTVSRKYGAESFEIEPEIDYAIYVAPFVASLPEKLQAAVEGASTTSDLRTKLTALSAGMTAGAEPKPTAVASDALAAIERLDADLGKGLVLNSFVDAFLRARVPRTFYFSTYSQLSGRYQLQEVFDAVTDGSDDESIQAAADFLTLARAVPANIEDWNFEQSNAELESVSSLLTKRVKEHWHQNDHLRLEVSLEAQQEDVGGQIRIKRFLQFRVQDSRHDFSSRLDRRSTGFQWFVSFLASFLEFEQDTNLMLLLDEPGLSLHARAQMDLLDTIKDKLAKGRQVLYSTHSPFMVKTDLLKDVRIVEDQGPDKGTAVIADAGVVADVDTLFPLQAALGYDVVQSLFIGNRNILVEGISDFIYLTMIGSHLESLGRTNLPLDARLLPAGGATNIPTFIALLGTQLDIVVLIDGNTSRQRIDNSILMGRLEETKVISLDSFSTVKGADIEDLFTPDEYIAFYNATYKKSVKLSDLKGTDRIVERISRLEGDFNHGEVGAQFLRTLDKSIASLSKDTLERFEKVILAINAALPIK